MEIAERVYPLGLGADVITGFPGETPHDHAETARLVAELPFTYLHVFPFSPRSGTVAADLVQETPVPQRVAGERSLELRDLAHEKALRHREVRVGSKAVVAPEGDGSSGLTGDYLRVDVTPPPEPGAVTLVEGTLRGDADHLYIAAPRERLRI